jgi:hypothetical protein
MKIIKIANERKIPIIEHAHNAQLKEPDKTSKIIHANLNKIICVSDFVLEKWNSLGVEKEKLIVVSNPIEELLFDPEKIDKSKIKILREKIAEEDEKIIFFPARVIRVSTMEIGEQKQFKQIVEALVNMKNKGFKFKFIFPGMKNAPNATPEKIKEGDKIVLDYLDKKGLNENCFIFENGIQLEEMPEIYAVSDIICMPSLNETFGMVFLESQAMKKPVIAAKSGAAPYVIEENKTGILITPGNVNELEIAIEKLIENKELRKKLGETGRKRAIEKFSLKKIIQKIERVYEEILK